MVVLSVLLSGGQSPIDLDGTFLVQIVIFFITFAALRSLVFKPMIALFDARRAAIEGTREEAQRLADSAREQGAEFEAEMRRVRSSAADEQDKLRAEGLKLERTLLEKVRRDTQKLLQDADQQMAREAVRVRGDLSADVPVLARQIASKLLGREVSQ
jgi:F-type H+-transporting ATPase subunit b